MADFKRAIQVLLVCVFTAMLGLGIISPIMPLYAQDLGATYTQIGLLSSAWSISRLIFSTPMGKYSDVKGRKRVIAAGLLIYATVSILYTFANDFTSLVSIRFIHGLGSAMSMPVAMAYAAELAPQGQEGRYMGNINMAMFAGMGLGPLIGGSLTDFFASKSVPFYVMSALTALSLLLTLAFLPEDRKQRELAQRPQASFRRVLSNKMLRAAFVYRAVGALGRGSVMGFLSIYVSGGSDVGGLGIAVSLTGLIMSVGQVTGAFMQRPFGELADRYDKVALTLIGGFLGAVGIALFPFASTSWTVLAAMLVFSVGGALGMPALTAIVAIEGRDIGVGTTMSVLQTSMSLGMISGPLASGILGEMFGLKPIFFIGGAIMLLGTVCFYVLQRYG